MKPGQVATEGGGRLGGGPDLLETAQLQEIRAVLDDVDDGNHSRFGQPSQPRGLGGEEAVRGGLPQFEEISHGPRVVVRSSAISLITVTGVAWVRCGAGAPVRSKHGLAVLDGSRPARGLA